nr:hypothetical protein JMPHXYHW_JMPHXYHW_CDS_0001 [uncultured phage]
MASNNLNTYSITGSKVHLQLGCTGTGIVSFIS